MQKLKYLAEFTRLNTYFINLTIKLSKLESDVESKKFTLITATKIPKKKRQKEYDDAVILYEKTKKELDKLNIEKRRLIDKELKYQKKKWQMK